MPLLPYRLFFDANGKGHWFVENVLICENCHHLPECGTCRQDRFKTVHEFGDVNLWDAVMIGRPGWLPGEKDLDKVSQGTVAYLNQNAVRVGPSTWVAKHINGCCIPKQLLILAVKKFELRQQCRALLEEVELPDIVASLKNLH